MLHARTDGLQAFTLASSLKPDLILMDMRMRNCDALDATRWIKAAMPDDKIVILTTSTDEANLFEAIRSGATGYLLKSMDTEDLVEVLNQAQKDIPPFFPDLAAKLLNKFARLSAEEVEGFEKDQPQADEEPKDG